MDVGRTRSLEARVYVVSRWSFCECEEGYEIIDVGEKCPKYQQSLRCRGQAAFPRLKPVAEPDAGRSDVQPTAITKVASL